MAFGRLKDKKSELFDLQVETFISEELSIEGDLKGNGGVRVDGVVRGQICTAQDLIVGTTGKVYGDVTVETVIAYGKIFGNITCSKLIVMPSSEIYGDICTTHIAIQLGGLVIGRIEMSRDREALPELASPLY